MQNKTEDGKINELLDCCSVYGKNVDLKICKECHKISIVLENLRGLIGKLIKLVAREKGETENHGEKDNETLSICAYYRVKGSHNACEYCTAVFYCSETCQRLDWRKHKTTCIAHRKN